MKILSTEIKNFPKLSLIGRRYTENDEQGDNFGNLWGKWQDGKQFLKLADSAKLFDDSPIGFMRYNNQSFEYWIVKFFYYQTQPKQGFNKIEIPESKVGFATLQGSNMREIYGGKAMDKSFAELVTQQKISGLKFANIPYFFEYYDLSKFQPQNGQYILDYGFYLPKNSI